MADQENDKNKISQAEGKVKAGNISRRKLMAVGAGASVAAASVMATSAAAMSRGQEKVKPRKNKNHADVIIVGGGFCGVTAARELGLQGYDITLLEARNRLGGRTFTAEFAGEMTDLGGTWVHWHQAHVWSEIDRYGIELEETFGAIAEDIIYLDYQGNRHKTKLSKIWANYSEFESLMSRYFENAYDIIPRPSRPFADDRWVKEDIYSLQDKLNSVVASDVEKIYLDTLLTTLGSSPPEQVSWISIMQMFALSGYTGTGFNDVTMRYKIKGGTKVLLEKIAGDSKSDIRLSTAVRKISQLEDGVEVITDAGERLTAKSLICTLPMNVLKDVEFSPALLKGKLDASRQTHAGKGTKVHIQLDKEYPVFGGWAPGGKAPMNYVLWDGVKHGKTHLIAFGPSTDTLDMNDTDDVEAAVRKFLPDARVDQAFGYGWNEDPYSQGVWAVSRPGQMSKFIGDLQKKQGNIHFANSDWASGWRGFIDGAIEQGLVAAHQVRDELKR
tara:strand:- start:4117 stop:5616 length:1500 start_codon:yes stop_codon:yes gene_type:complete